MTLKAIYRGPSHYWHTYSLTPRDRFYYGYYGMYGPQVHLQDYEIIEDDENKVNKVEGFGCECVDEVPKGCDINKTLLWIVIIVALMMIYFK